MTTSSLHAATFYKEVAKTKIIWSIRDSGGIPAPKNTEGIRSMPFWSSKSRAEKIIQNVEAYKGFESFPIPLSEFSSRWVQGLTKDRLLVGLNWSGSRAIGYDVLPCEAIKSIELFCQ